jgi:hypothetical protein
VEEFRNRLNLTTLWIDARIQNMQAHEGEV